MSNEEEITVTIDSEENELTEAIKQRMNDTLTFNAPFNVIVLDIVEHYIQVLETAERDCGFLDDALEMLGNHDLDRLKPQTDTQRQIVNTLRNFFASRR